VANPQTSLIYPGQAWVPAARVVLNYLGLHATAGRIRREGRRVRAQWIRGKGRGGAGLDRTREKRQPTNRTQPRAQDTFFVRSHSHSFCQITSETGAEEVEKKKKKQEKRQGHRSEGRCHRHSNRQSETVTNILPNHRTATLWVWTRGAVQWPWGSCRDWLRWL